MWTPIKHLRQKHINPGGARKPQQLAVRQREVARDEANTRTCHTPEKNTNTTELGVGEKVGWVGLRSTRTSASNRDI